MASELPNDARTRADLYFTLGNSYRSFNRLDVALALFDSASILHARIISPDSYEVARDIESYGNMLQESGKIDSADAAFRNALARYRAMPIQNGHLDYLHNGHLHHQAGSLVEEHRLEVSAANPADCTPTHPCGGHKEEHVHSDSCGHAAVPHGDHIDYLVDGHLHHPHGSHCDFHGSVMTAF